MRKLKLDLEELEVETFEAAEDLEQRGTVHGADTIGGWVCNGSDGGSGNICSCEISICIPCAPDSYYCSGPWIESCYPLQPC